MAALECNPLYLRIPHPRNQPPMDRKQYFHFQVGDSLIYGTDCMLCITPYVRDVSLWIWASVGS